jgi:D-amino-acid dehydrogenase
MNAVKTDVLILGGGVIGLFAAVELVKSGRAVTVLDRSTVGSGSSHGNCGTITPSHAPPLAMPGQIAKALKWMFEADAPFYVKPRPDPALLAWLLRFALRCNWADFRAVTHAKAALLLRSRERLEAAIREHALDCDFEALGTLNVFRDAHAFEQAMWLPQTLAEVGLPVDVLDAAATRAAEPALNDSIVGAFRHRADAHLRPEKLAAELARRLRELGGEIVENEAVVELEFEAQCVSAVRTTKGARRARDVVFALGAWSPLLARRFGARIPIQPGKGYSITFERPAICPRVPVTLKERSVCVTAWNGGYRLGSTMEFSGYDESLNRTRLDALTRAAGEYLREPTGPVRVEEWYGWRPMTWDDMPIIGRSSHYTNLIYATGHGMLGVTMAAVTAELVSDVLHERRPAFDAGACAPQRFGL